VEEEEAEVGVVEEEAVDVVEEEAEDVVEEEAVDVVEEEAVDVADVVDVVEELMHDNRLMTFSKIQQQSAMK
jgi:hypothetical protein